MRPNTISYNTVMSAYAKRGQAAEAEALLEEMYLDYTTNENKSAKPDVTCYNIVMDCWAKSGQNDVGDKSLALLRELQSLFKQGDQTMRPNTISYSTVMIIYANQGQAAEVEALVEEVYLDHHTAFGLGSAQPDVTIF
jgi:pentatricopeptide repeat protein